MIDQKYILHHTHSHKTSRAESNIIHSFLAGVLWLEPFWIALVGVSLLLRDYFWEAWMQPWLVGALFLFWPLRLAFTRRLAPPGALNWPILALLVWSPVTLWVSYVPTVSWEALGNLALGIALYFALVNWRLAQRHSGIVVALLTGAGLALAAIGPAILLNISNEFLDVSTDLTRSKPAEFLGTNETINPNILAGALLLPIPLLLALSIRQQWIKPRWLALLVLLPALLMMGTLILAQSRGAYLAFGVGLVLLCVLRWPRRWWVLLIPLIAAGSVLAGDGFSLLGLFFNQLISDGSVSSLSGRQEIWLRALYALRDFPLTGIGIGTFAQIIPALYPYMELARSVNIPHAHNLLLQIGVDLGIPGLLIYLWLLFTAFRILISILRADGKLGDDDDLELLHSRRQRWQIQRQRRRFASWRWALAAGTLTALTMMLIHGMVDAVTWGTKVAFLPWLLFALTGLLDQQSPIEIETAAEAA